MKRFVFKLERLERLRDVQRREARSRLADAMTELDSRRATREEHEAQLQAAVAATPSEPGEHVARELKQILAWQADRAERVGLAEADESIARDRVEEALAQHAEAAREHKVLGRLRQKRRVQWQQEADTEERKFLDEVHLQRLARRSNGDTEEEPCDR